jgi:hypothetical protein
MSEIKITVPDQPEEQAQVVARGTTWAESLVITSQDDRQKASVGIGNMKGMVKEVQCLFAESKQAASAAHKAVCAAEKRLLDPIKDAIDIATSKVIAYDNEQDRIRREQEAKIKAAQEAESKRLEAIAKRCKDDEKKEAYVEQARMVADAPIAVANVQQKADGEVRKTVWKAELVNLQLVIEAAAQGNESAQMMLAFNHAAANRLAAMCKRDGVVPGLRFFSTTQIQHRL